MKHLTICLLVLLVSLTGCRKKQPAEQAEPDNPGSSAPAPRTVNLIDADARKDAAALEGLDWVKGGPVSLTDGKVYVVEFWATWCPPCRTSIPHLTDVQAAFKDKGVTVIGISNESIETVKPFVVKMGEKMEYTVAIDTDGKADTGYMKAYRRNGIPTAFVVDSSGKIAWIGHPMDNLEGVLEAVTAAASTASAN